MITAFGRLFGIFFLVVFGLFLAGLTFRTMGQNQQFSPFQHPLREAHGPVHFSPAGMNSSFYSFTVRPNRQGQWYIANNDTDLNAAENFFTFLDAHPESFIYVDILHPGAPVVQLFFDELLKRPNHRRFLVQSNFHDTLRIARERSVQILTGSSVSEVGRMLLLTNLFLEPLIDPAGEFVVIDHLIPRLMQELLRRHKFVFIRDATPDEQAQLNHDFPQVMFLTTRNDK